ncbi:hypothetical protein GCM10027612_15150 [Microbispora bryophytorum subsp. camponoti]
MRNSRPRPDSTSDAVVGETPAILATSARVTRRGLTERPPAMWGLTLRDSCDETIALLIRFSKPESWGVRYVPAGPRAIKETQMSRRTRWNGAALAVVMGGTLAAGCGAPGGDAPSRRPPAHPWRPRRPVARRRSR